MPAATAIPHGWRLEQPAPTPAPTGARRGRLLAVLERIVLGAASSGEHAAMAAQRLLLHLERTKVPLRHVWGVFDEQERAVAGALVLPSPGRTAQVLAARPRDASEVVATARAIDAAVAGLGPVEAVLAQALLDVAPLAASGAGDGEVHAGHEAAGRSERPGLDAGVGAPRLDASTALLARALQSAAFTPLATLDYLSRRMPRRGEALAPALPGAVTIAPWRRGDAAHRAELQELLDRTYEATLDCPGLCGLRDTPDILEGHLAGARYEPGLWSVARVDGKAAGALLMSVGHSGNEIELVYLGVARDQRGRGLGRLLLASALGQLAGRRERRICLAVDRDNAPAVQLYASAGFAPVGSRIAMIRSLRARP